MAGGRDFDRSKFKELVLHLSQRSQDDEGFGMVKLNKLLFWADFEAFRLLGRSITGETYEKQEYGPVARDLPLVLDELAQSGYVIWQHPSRGPYVRDVPAAAEEPDLAQFSADELRIIERALDELAAHGGKTASEWSHEQSAGWNVTPAIGEAISYETAFVSTEPIPREDLERAAEFVRESGWLSEQRGS